MKKSILIVLAIMLSCMCTSNAQNTNANTKITTKTTNTKRPTYKKSDDVKKAEVVPIAETAPTEKVEEKTSEEKAEENKVATNRLMYLTAEKLVEKGLTHFLVKDNYLFGKFLAKAVVLPKTGEVIADAGQELNEEVLASFDANKVKNFEILYIDNVNVGPYIRNTLEIDRNSNREEALGDIYKVMRPGEPVTLEASETIFKHLFFDEERYDLSSVGRVKMNSALDIPFSEAYTCAPVAFYAPSKCKYREKKFVETVVLVCEALYKLCNVTNTKDIEELISYSEKEFNTIDIWINNAGVNQPEKAIWELNEEEIDLVLNVDLKGAVIGSKLVMEEMSKQHSGAIYNIEGYGYNNYVKNY